MLRNLFIALPIAALAIGGSTACATKKFVRTSVGEVNQKVDALGHSVEETQERQRQAEGRITEVDQRAQAAAAAASSAAQKAGSVAEQAGSAAADAKNTAVNVGGRVETMDKANRRLVYEVVISEDQGNFKFGQATLPDEAKAKIDELVQHLKQDPKNVYIEIEGHTDNVGTTAMNEKLGLERAEAVKRYFYEQYQVPLHKMAVISYGEAKPAGPNKTKSDRAKNRRVVIKVLA